MKQKFQKMSKDGYNYEKLINLVPIKNYWIQSKEVRMHPTKWVPSLSSRTTYYKPTVGKQCEHKDTWTEEDDMLLIIRECIKCLSVQLLRSYKLICIVSKFANISFLWMVEKFKISFRAILSFMQIDLHGFKNLHTYNFFENFPIQ